MFDPVKTGFGVYLKRFYDGLAPTTKQVKEFSERGFDKSAAWCVGRMVDDAEKMLEAWQKNDTDQSDTRPPKLPVILTALDSEYTPVDPEFSYQITEPLHVVIADDAKSRLFGLQTITAQLRMQVVIIATDQPTALSLAAQLGLFFKHPGNRRFNASHTFAGVTESWPVQMVDNTIPFLKVTTDYKNVHILAGNLLLNTTVPLYDAPRLNNPDNDENGIPETDDPAGYAVVVEIDANGVSV